MATNSFFSRHTHGEQQVIEDLTIEAIKIHGKDMVYIPRKYVNEDTLFGEDTISKFDDARGIEMYIENVDGFEGEGDFLSKFGLQIKDSMTVVVSKKRFLETFSYRSDFDRPREGDLIYFPLTKGIFEITFVEHENPFYQVGKLYTYKLTCQLFKYSDETIDTDFSAIDDIEENYSYQFDLALITGDNVDGGNFITGENVTQTQTSGSVIASVVSWSDATKILRVKDFHVTGTANGFLAGNNILVAGDSGSKWLIATGGGSTVTGGMTMPNDTYADNLDIETMADDLFDFTDMDPFSEGNY
tara:strand:- start:49 stop:951 length:903 start_codon:yes stop_codon:yes gene_type:complete